MQSTPFLLKHDKKQESVKCKLTGWLMPVYTTNLVCVSEMLLILVKFREHNSVHLDCLELYQDKNDKLRGTKCMFVCDRDRGVQT